MSRARAAPVFVAVALLVSTLTATAAHAQLDDPVDRARAERAEAEARLRDATSGLRRAQSAKVRADDLARLVGSDLATSVIQYQQINADLEDATFRLAALRERIIGMEYEVRELRRSTRDFVTQAYMAGGSADLAAFFAVDTYTDLITGRTVLARASEMRRGAADDLTAGRSALDDLRLDRDSELARLHTLQRDSERTVGALDVLFADAESDARVAAGDLDAARGIVADADASLQRAVRRLDEEIARRRLISPGVEKWRSLVVKYFPDHRVAEAMSVMQCESSGVATAVHPASGASGLFQFLAGTWAIAAPAAGFPNSDRFDPEANIASAAWLVAQSVRTGHPRGPWGHWSCQP